MGGHPPATPSQSLQQVTHIGSPIQVRWDTRSLRVDVRVPIGYGSGALLDLDSVHRRISSGDSQGTGGLQYGRALHALTETGLVRRIELAGSQARFEGRVASSPDADRAVGEAPCLTASDDRGFSTDEAEVIYWGLCPGCSTARSS
ncbi:transcriptional repressor [Actinacidiphila oryziradicis]|uniref:transcriptional repressor n=1 Tax=Actinacidiphila oryziradicis TaxID=2571141 RepID=UPI003898FDC8